MPLQKATLTVEVTYDPQVTDAESIACAADRLLETALSTPGFSKSTEARPSIHFTLPAGQFKAAR